MRVIDLSQPLFDGCPNCPAHARVTVELVASHARDGAEAGGGWHLEQLSMASHTGSHVDAPLHKVMGGASLDEVPLEQWMGAARIVDFRDLEANAAITPVMLAGKLDGDLTGHWVLLATGFGDKRAHSREWLHEPPVLTVAGAEWLAQRCVRGVGIDHYSIGDAATHAALLGAEPPVLIVEELHFPAAAFVLRPPVQFQAFPLNLRGGSGAPCRPVLVVP